jgi:hypothetical protein
VSKDQQFNLHALKFKSLEQIFELAKNEELQGNSDLRFRVSELQNEVDISQKQRYRKEILKLDDKKKDIAIFNNHQEENSISASSAKKRKEAKQEKWQKDLSKRIALKTHPDKLGDIKDEDLQYYTNVYRKASTAYSESNDPMLLVCGHDVRLKPKNFNEEHVEILKNANKIYTDTIKQVYQSSGYSWYHMPEKDKTIFLINYVKQMGFTINKKQASEIIKRVKPVARKKGERPLPPLKNRRNNL